MSPDRRRSPDFIDKLGCNWSLARYAQMVARTMTREGMTQGTIQRLREHWVQLARSLPTTRPTPIVYYGNAIVCIGDESHPVYRPSPLAAGPPFQPRCAHAILPFVDRLATDEEKKAGTISPDLLNRPLAELRRRYRQESRSR